MTDDGVKIKKIETGTLCLLAAVIILIILLAAAPFAYFLFRNAGVRRTDSPDDYLSGDYASYNGGEEAQIFFDSFAAHGGDINSFSYRDNDAAFTLKSAAHTVFALDIKYSPEDYTERKGSIWENTDMPDGGDGENFFGSFLIATVCAGEEIYEDNCCCVCFNDSENIIRFLMFYDIDRREALKDGIKPIIRASISLDWYE